MVMVTGKLLVSSSCYALSNHHTPFPAYGYNYGRWGHCRGRWLTFIAITDRRQRAPPELRPDLPNIARRRWQLLCHE